MSAKSPRQHLDVHQAVTAKIINSIEAGAGPFQLPWIQTTGAALGRPTNVETHAPYNGVNVLVLWIEALARNYASSQWGTFLQWRSRGAQVRKGETATLIVFYKPLARDQRPATDVGEEVEPRMVIRASHVFNACQVDGFEGAEAPQPCSGAARLADVEGFVQATGARVLEGGSMAAYDPRADQICIPPASAFVGSPTSSPTESYYATLCHELVHWSGAKHRLARDLTGRFGSQAYAMEELIAELGAAFLCADLGIAPQPRADHAAYIQSWLEVLKADKRAIFTAASKASQAAGWLEKSGRALRRAVHCSAVNHVLRPVACNEIGVFLLACRPGDVEAQEQRFLAQPQGARVVAGQRKIVAHAYQPHLLAGRVRFDDDEVSGAGRRASSAQGRKR